jgi:hypothetical protein
LLCSSQASFMHNKKRCLTLAVCEQELPSKVKATRNIRVEQASKVRDIKGQTWPQHEHISFHDLVHTCVAAPATSTANVYFLVPHRHGKKKRTGLNSSLVTD